MKIEEQKKFIKFLGTAVTLLAILFIIKKLYFFQWNSTDFEIKKHVLELGSLSGIFALHMVLVGVPWRIMVEFFSGQKIPYEEAAFVLCKSNLYKYIPGNIFQYVGRNELAVRNAVSHGKVALATMTDVVCNFGSILLLSLLLCGARLEEFLTYYGLDRYDRAVYFILAAGMLGGILTVLWAAKKPLPKGRLLEAALKGLFCVLYYFFLGIYTALMFSYITAVILSEPVLLSELPALMGGYLFGWAAGFVMPGSPGGIGIREAVTVLMLSASFSQKTVLLAILLYRLVNVAGDVLAFILAALILDIRKKR